MENVCIAGVGVALPTRVVTTREVEERVQIGRFGLEPGWLERVTGVHERRWAEPEVNPSDLAIEAGGRALRDAGLDPSGIDALIFAGITRDFIEPATANVVADRLKVRRARVFDITNACNSLIDAIDVADSLIRAGKAERILVATGERASISINWKPRTPEEFFRSVGGLVVGDGGGAVVLAPSDDGERGLREREFRTFPQHWRLAIGGRFGPTTEACGQCGSVVDLRFLCDGRALFEAGFELMPPTITAALDRTGWTFDDVNVVFCHEASRRFIEMGVAQLNGQPSAGPKIWSTVGRFGNTTTFSLPLGMVEAREAGALVAGSKVLAIAGSSGMSMAALTLVW